MPAALRINSAWKNAGFRGYADHMQTPEFSRSIDEIVAQSAGNRMCVMCAEAVPWRCHRSLIADAVTVRGLEVRHIMSATRADLHRLTPFARVDGSRITYPGLLA